MDILSNIIAGSVVEVGKFVSKSYYSKIGNTLHFSSNIENLSKEMEKLTKFRDDIKDKVEEAKEEGYKPKPAVINWLKYVEKRENEWELMQESIAAAKELAYKCFPNCSLRSKVSSQALSMRNELSWLMEIGENFESNLVVENYQLKRVEFIPAPSIEGQSAATRYLKEILQLLEDDKVFIIGVWGMGGVGKTTLMKNLNNELLKSTKLSFGIVVWVTVPRPTDIRKVQAQIAKRLQLKVDDEENLESIASKIHQRFREEKSFLLIMDDVWEAIHLNHIGVPQPEDSPARSKVILTTRSLDVCRQMRTDKDMKVYTLDEEESWQTFVKNAGEDANLKHIQPLAKEIARECDGLPLAVTVIGASMRGKKRVELWKDALASLKMSEPHNKDVKDEVYKVIKWSFDSLESPDDIELSSERNKARRGDIKSCFLYCSLYPMAISANDLIHCWWAEGFLGEHNTYEEAYNRGIAMIESLNDACLLDAHKLDSVKMHDVVRDVAIWIANSLGDEHNYLIRAGIGLDEISHIKMSSSVKRISFANNKIERLPNPFIKFPETTTLILHDNNPLEKIPREFFLAFPALRVLNLSRTRIAALPSSINSLYQLHALILQSCECLKELPPISNLGNLQLIDCADTRLRCLPQGMDKLRDLKLLNLPVADLEGIDEGVLEGVLVKLSSIEMINMLDSGTGVQIACFDELSSLDKLTSLSIRLDRSSNFKRDHTWMTRLKKFHIEVGELGPMELNFDVSTKTICVHKCEIFSEGELSGMLQSASDLNLVNCMGLRNLIAYNSFDGCNSFDGLKSLYIRDCYCNFPREEASGQTIDTLPNLEYLRLDCIVSLKSISDFGGLLGLRFSKLRQLEVYRSHELTRLFSVGGGFPVPMHLEEITVTDCDELEALFVQRRGSSQTTTTLLDSSEIPRVRKLWISYVQNLRNLGEPQKTWEDLEELSLISINRRLRKLPLTIQTSKNIKVIRGEPEWWSQLEWDDDKFRSNLEHCFQAI